MTFLKNVRNGESEVLICTGIRTEKAKWWKKWAYIKNFWSLLRNFGVLSVNWNSCSFYWWRQIKYNWIWYKNKIRQSAIRI